MSARQLKIISTGLKKFDEELQGIINETSPGTGSQHLSNAVIFLKKAIEEIDNSVKQSIVNYPANGLN